MQVANIREVVKTHKSILNWGPPISGHTFSLWTLVRWLKDNNLGKLHMFDIDGKCESLVLKLDQEKLLDHAIFYRYTMARDKIKQAEKSEKATEAFLEFTSDLNKLHDMIDPRTREWSNNEAPGAVAIDSLTSYSDMVNEFVFAKLGHAWGDTGSDARQDSVKIMDKIVETINSVKTLPCISVWNAHEQFDRDDVVGKIMCIPKVLGKGTLAPSLARMFNVVLYCEQVKEGEKYKYQWLTRPDPARFLRSLGMTSRLDYPATIPQDYRGVL